MPKIKHIQLPDPPTTRSGDDFPVTITYETDGDGSLEIAYLGTYHGTPGSVDLPADGSPFTFSMSIVRIDDDRHNQCEIEFSFGTLDHELMKVT